jgi:DNA-binding NarL/FixJ family response regulator
MAKLTARELAVARLVAQGLTNLDVGEMLGISEQTAKNHLWSVYRKLGVENRVQLVRRIDSECRDRERPGGGRSQNDT